MPSKNQCSDDHPEEVRLILEQRFRPEREHAGEFPGNIIITPDVEEIPTRPPGSPGRALYDITLMLRVRPCRATNALYKVEGGIFQNYIQSHVHKHEYAEKKYCHCYPARRIFFRLLSIRKHHLIRALLT